jgi:hypothetical protein
MSVSACEEHKGRGNHAPRTKTDQDRLRQVIIWLCRRGGQGRPREESKEYPGVSRCTDQGAKAQAHLLRVGCEDLAGHGAD